MTGRFVEVKTGRGSASLVQGGVDGHDELDETRGRGKGKGYGGKGESGGKGDMGGKGFQQSMRTKKGEEELRNEEKQQFQQSAKTMKGEEELRSEENETQKELMDEEEQETAEEDEGRVRMAPNMGAGGSHPQATTDPEEKKQHKGGQWVLRPTREWRSELSLVGKWADFGVCSYLRALSFAPFLQLVNVWLVDFSAFLSASPHVAVVDRLEHLAHVHCHHPESPLSSFSLALSEREEVVDCLGNPLTRILLDLAIGTCRDACGT